MPGQRIGLLGGSFDPPHAGHIHITRWALRAVGLDHVWWVVSPGNPLKDRGPADLDRRVEAARRMIRHPRVIVTDIERYLNSPFTANTLLHLNNRYPGVRFVWLMGADNLITFHHWEGWEWILRETPVCVLGRPGAQVQAGLSLAAQRFSERRIPQSAAASLGREGRARWCLLTGAMSDLSSTQIRGSGAWP
jgi:nicotinate-nucleotide adenylyltransferase